MTFAELGIDTRGKRGKTGTFKTKCPKCQADRKKNKTDTPLSVNPEKGVWKCHHCEWRGSLASFAKDEKVRNKANIPVNKTYSTEFLKQANGRGISQKTLEDNFVFERDGYWHQPVFWGVSLVNQKSRKISDKNQIFQIGKKDGGEQVFIGTQNVRDSTTLVITEGEWDMLIHFFNNR